MTQSPAQDRLEEIRKRLEVAIQGPWDIGVERQFPSGYRCFPSFNNPAMSYEDATATADFIAHSLQDMSSLLEQIVQLRAELTSLKEVLGEDGIPKEGFLRSRENRIKALVAENEKLRAVANAACVVPDGWKGDKLAMALTALYAWEKEHKDG